MPARDDACWQGSTPLLRRFWDWDRWEREIDWMALWGVNLVLAYTGQEQLFKDVYNSMGVNDSVLERTFDGPAFLTWYSPSAISLGPLTLIRGWVEALQ